MRLLVPAASAALAASVALSATAAVSTAGAQPTQASSTQASSAQAGSTTWVRPHTPSSAGATALATRTATGNGTETALGTATRVAPGRGFAWPLSPRPVVLRPFEQPRSQWSSGHRGVDLQAIVGQAVLSAGDGVVTFSGVIAGRGVITVRHAGGLRTTYEPVDHRLTSTTVVHRGVPIGVISSVPGHCLPLTCLHWGAVVGPLYRDPLSLLGFGRPILLPLG